MRQILCLTVALLIVVVISGCRSGIQGVHDHQRYETGEIKAGSSNYSYQSGIYPLTHNIDNVFSNSSEFYRDSRLKSEVWSQGSHPLMKLEFYESGRLKSEERYDNGVVIFGMYFTEEGELARTVGQRLKK